jgi:hypothetical protein
MADLGQQPAHDSISPLVQDDFNERSVSGRLNDLHEVGSRRPVVQLNPGEQPTHGLARQRTVNLG